VSPGHRAAPGLLPGKLGTEMTDRAAVPAGILCALVTPFGEDQSPDPGPLRAVIDFLIDRGVHGLFVLGTTGEGPMLDATERRGTAGLAVGHVDGRVPLVLHCGAPDTRTTAGLAEHGDRIGADGVAAVVPYFFRHGPEDLFRHFETVAAAAPGLPHYVYENPERVGYSAGVSVVASLVNEVPNVVGVKDTGDTIGKITDYLSQPGRPIQVYVGNNSTILPALVVGARGAVSAMANAVPELAVAVFDRWNEGRLDQARELQFVLARLTAALAGVPFVGGVKHLMARRGLPAGGCRAPQAVLTPGQAEAVDARLSQIEGAERWLEPVGSAARAVSS
jgi:dihydrodipicolinate synthase/N-acetylneuraminate lyase